jgi:hypothetical protein
MKIILLASVILMAMSSESVFAAEGRIASKGKTQLQGRTEGLKVLFEIFTRELPIKERSRDAAARNCTNSIHPCRLIDSARIVVNGTELFMPRSLLSDCSDLLTAEIVPGDSSGEGAIMLHGGDASEAYHLRITFTKDRIKKRTLWSVFDTDQPLQETLYFDPPAPVD